MTPFPQMIPRPLHHFTLIETLISIFLASFIFSALFSCLHLHTKSQMRMQHARAGLLERGAMQQRIHSLFLSLSPLSLMRHSFPDFPPLVSGEQKEKHFPPQLFYLAEDQLYFVYHHPIDPHPDFCGPLLGTLTLRKNTLYLVSQKEAHKEQRAEPLCSQVHGVKFEMIYQDPQGGYVESTTGEIPFAHSFPRAIKMTIEHLSRKEVQFIFWLPTPATPITYRGEL